MSLSLNKYQKEAVLHTDGPCLVTSCPGSGKTLTIVERIVRLITDGVKPKNILCLTFTNKAANEMKERICKRLNVEKVDFFIGTFHSLCAKMIRKIGPTKGYKSNFSIIDDRDQLDLVFQIAGKLGVEINKADAFKIVNRLNFYRDQMEDFEWVENSLNSEPHIEVAKKYLEHCHKNHLLDFSALIYENIKIIESDEDLTRKVQNTFKYIMVDETQDTNISQFYLINLLGGKWKNIMLIGDIDQCIIEGEEVLTPDGYKKIEELDNKDMIICMEKDQNIKKKNEYYFSAVEANINKIYKKEVVNYPIVKIETTLFKEAIYSKDHMIFASLNDKQKEKIFKKIGELPVEYIERNAWHEFFYLIPAYFIEKGMKVISYHSSYDKIKSLLDNENCFFFDHVDEVTYENYNGFLYDLDIDKHHNFISGTGIASHNSIYGWRGARHQNIQDFINNYSDCKVISLSKNYRSTPQIVSAASKLIKFNTSHMGTAFETDNNDGEKVKCISFRDQYSEGKWVGKIARKFIDEGGWEPSDMAVLYRANRMSEPVEQALVSNSIPYEVIGAWNFYDRKEVRDCLAMLKLLANPSDGIAFGRICSFMEGIGPVTVGKIENLAQEKNVTIPQACKIMGEQVSSIKIARSCEKLNSIYSKEWDYSNPSSCMSQLIDNFNYEHHLSDKFNDTYNERKENISQIVSSAGECCGDKDGVSKYLQQVALITNADKQDKKDKMPLMSIHASKGLEFPIVFMIGVEQDILPHKNAIAEDPYEGLEEERRLCYVAASRAKKVLFISYCKNRKRFGKHGNMTFYKCKPSRFLYEMGLLKKEN